MNEMQPLGVLVYDDTPRSRWQRFKDRVRRRKPKAIYYRAYQDYLEWDIPPDFTEIISLKVSPEGLLTIEGRVKPDDE